MPIEFNRRTFAQAGVEPRKLIVIPPCLDVRDFEPVEEEQIRALPASFEGKFVFLSIFDWTYRKGWDLLLRAFLEEFEGQET